MAPFFRFGKDSVPLKRKKALCAYEFYIILSVSLVLLFFVLTVVHPRSQNGLVFQGGFDFLSDHINHVKYTYARNVYTAEGAPVLENSGVFCLAAEGQRQDRLFPPLAYMMLYLPRSMTAMTLSAAPMFLVTALWSVVLWSGILLLTCFVQIHGPTWKKVLFCFAFFFSGVMLYATERGTLVLLSSSLTAFFIFNYQSRDAWLRELALIALAFAAGLKLSPAILGLLPAMDRRWKDCVKLLIYGLTAFFLPFAFLQGGWQNLRYLFENIVENGEAYLTIGHHVGVGFTGKALDVICTTFGMGAIPEGNVLNHILYYLCAAAAAGGVILAFFERESWKRIFLMILPILFIPKDSGYYNLLYLLPVIILICNDRHELNFYTRTVLILFAVLFMPLQVIPCQKELIGVVAMDLLAAMVILSSLKRIVGNGTAPSAEITQKDV